MTREAAWRPVDQTDPTTLSNDINAAISTILRGAVAMVYFSSYTSKEGIDAMLDGIALALAHWFLHFPFVEPEELLQRIYRMRGEIQLQESQ